MSTPAINGQLAKVLGIDTARCTGFDLRVRFNEFPSVTVYRHANDLPEIVATRFKLVTDDDVDIAAIYEDMLGRVSQPAKPFDLDEACREAMLRVQEHVDRLYVAAVLQLSIGRLPMRLHRPGERHVRR